MEKNNLMQAMRLLLLAAVGWLVGNAHAGSFSVSPVRVHFGTQRNVAVVQVVNTSDRPLALQAQAVHWPAAAGTAGAVPLVVNPAIAKLAPGATQTVRIGLLDAQRGTTERSYRVYFTELPSPRGDGDGDAAGPALGVSLRVGVPVFVAPAFVDSAALTWRLAGTAGAPSLEVHNPGNVHQTLSSLQVQRVAQRADLALPSPYLLPGQTLRLPLDAGFALASGDALTLHADGSAGKVERRLVAD